MEPVGIKTLECMVYIVRDLERSRRFYVEHLDFAIAGESTPEHEAASGERTILFQAHRCKVLVVAPVTEESRAAKWLKTHPAGVAELVFQVQDADKALKLIESRGGTPICDVEEQVDGDGRALKQFGITTPFQAVWRFVERVQKGGLYQGIKGRELGEHNSLRFGHFDHITSNFSTLSPALLWMEHVMGFERYWGINFHTVDVDPARTSGSGLKSVVMWDPNSGVKFANNEPQRPFFDASQIALFVQDLRSDGIQHAAMTVRDIIPAVRQMREKGLRFMPTPASYYDMMPQRIEQSGIQRIDEEIETLRELEILIDGKAEHAYLLQIFMQEAAGLYEEADAGPFFYEVIQRKGDKGFGGGNFRALFESIERQQRAEGRI